MVTELQLASTAELGLVLPLVEAFHVLAAVALTAAEREAAVKALLSDRHLGGIWLIYDQGELTGYVALCLGYSLEFGGRDAFIDELYLRPECQGRGLGTATLALIKVEAQKLGIRALHLEVDADNLPAQRLYRRAQFQPRDQYLAMTIRL
ncbi:MAG: GNAT family N-acetyltransferase [Leptolyngbya sp. RL_3_1]|nr:GNAT family N-acetyltransferase [Leptolyngbya sp. RL_3_1]